MLLSMRSDFFSDTVAAPDPAAQPGQLLARGVCRALLGHDFVPMVEMVPAPGLRVDVMALGPKGEIWIVECKSCRADFTSDRKWRGYLAYCDRFFWAVDTDFPQELLPAESGLILADGYGAEILRWPECRALPAARRKVVTRAFARQSARQLRALRDPGPGTRR
ncbi:hypothetical protein GCM10008024_39590 [Allgaiera indica]|uniref:DNA repair protein MmcB-related protein n=2 Tax=Allgaiera indica TaxID=765699 RepID=A0AAN5A1U4_9RHOB|nr:hypothetical protein GCM10008024_39590 [Allgaiera indica]SDX86586.1 hypothetical protein SAMN05444006_13518 [Allgaiera indica]